ncbi:hypothetical protein OG589_16945 [Sphaerisporangium sp. NBC_01403]|uniref:hypothetical protein n=1 Tax=Sphaerisporangium sp. NBC_01403 TaxID=2903599 RepID=UPI00324C5863
MPLFQRHSLVRVISASLSLAGSVALAPPAAAHAGASSPSVPAATSAGPATGGKPKIEPVPAIVVPPEAKVSVPDGPSLAARPVQARPIGPEPPPVTTPAGPALAGKVAANATARLRSEGLVSAGRPGPDASRLLPATERAGVLSVSKPPASAIGATAAKVKSPAGVDLAGLYRALPEGIPLVTYRLCAETPSLPVSCSAPQPLVKPVAADVTGDGTPDLLASVVPSLSTADVASRARALASTQRELDSLLGRTTGGLLGPSGAKDSSSGQVESRRDRQRDDLTARLAAGLGLATTRLATSETHGRALRAQVWAQYDIPASNGSMARRLSIGFDGFHRGASLSGTDWGLYRLGAAAGQGAVTDVRVSVRRSRPGASVATVAGIAGLDGRESVDPKVVSLRQSPVPERLTVSARFDGDRREGTMKIASSGPSALDALVLDAGRSAKPYEERFTQVVLDKVRSQVSVELTRPSEGGAEVHFAGTAPMGRAELHDFVYGDGRLSRVIEGSLTGVPADFRARYESVDGRSEAFTVDTAPRARAVDVVYFDRAAAKTVFRMALTDLPAHMRIYYDIAGNRVTHTASSKIGGVELVLQRDGGAVSTPAGSHLTMIKNGGQVGLSGRLSALAGFDVTYGARPHATLRLASGRQPFLAAASVDRTHLLRMDISNAPREVEVDLDPAAKKARYRASGVIGKLRASYANVKAGPTIDSSLYGVRSRVDGSWRLGDRSSAEVTTASSLKKAELYASRAYVTEIGPTGGEDVHATVRDVHRHVAVVADLAGRRLDWTADRPVASVLAFARADYQGRRFSVAAKATGVPARFEAGWGDGTYRFRGVSGPVGSVTLAVTNHDGARAPSGPHLAAHYRAATGDLDASVRVDGLTSVEFGGSDAGFKAAFQAARQSVALDADVYLAGDLRFGALGTLGPIPGGIEVSAAGGGPVTYSASGARMDLKAQVWLGKVAAINGISGVPGVASGVALADGGCVPGSADCAGDQGPFCAGASTPADKGTGASTDAAKGEAAARGCFGVRGFVSLAGLPSKVTVDPARRTFSFSGYRPAVRKLEVYLASEVLAPVPIRALATLDGLPRSITGMSVGPFEAGRGKDADGRDANVIKVNYRVEPAATITSLKALAEADTGDRYGVVRGRVLVDPVPAVVAIDGTYGKKTHLRVQNSAAVRRLTAEVTLTPRAAKPGTGVARFTDVPAAFTIDADGASRTGLRMPALAYKADGGENTLDGLFAVEGALVSQVYRPERGELLDASFVVKDLASDTTAKINPDLSVDLASRPVATRLLEVHAGLSVGPVERQRVAVRKDIPYTTGFFALRLDGDFALGQSRIEDVSLGVHGMSWLRIRPGRIPFGMRAPSELGYISPGFEGAYDHVDIRAGGIDLRPDVKLDVRIARSVGKDVFKDTLRLGPATSLEFRRYDQRTRPISARQALKVGATPIACLSIDTRPGFAAARRAGSITLRGADGPQMVSLLDPGGQVQGYALDLLSQFMSPFAGAGWKVSGLTTGRCR